MIVRFLPPLNECTAFPHNVLAGAYRGFSALRVRAAVAAIIEWQVPAVAPVSNQVRRAH